MFFMENIHMFFIDLVNRFLKKHILNSPIFILTHMHLQKYENIIIIHGVNFLESHELQTNIFPQFI